MWQEVLSAEEVLCLACASHADHKMKGGLG